MTRSNYTRSGRPTETPGLVKKNLLQITIKLLNAVGRQGATARAICTEAGVGAPVIYHHYGDLNGLYQAAIEESFRQVASCYKLSAKAKGPLQGIRDSWALFMHFAYDQPRMCRIVIEQILAGDPPRAVERTLHNISKDIAEMEAAGNLNYSPDMVSKMLWVGALGSVGFIATERGRRKRPDPVIHESVLEAILARMFAKPPTKRVSKAASAKAPGKTSAKTPTKTPATT